MNLWIGGLIAFLLSSAGTYFVRRWALRSGLLDVPNARSSHQEATPRGGGIAIVCSVSVMLTWWALPGGGERWSLLLAIVVGGLVIAVVGYLDDRYHLRPIARLVAHTFAAIWAVAWLGGVPDLQCGNRVVDLGWVGDVVGVVALVWALNLFNFMDGIDGIAASEATFMCLAGALLIVFAGRSSDVAMASTVVGLASAGFLVWNWPRAKIFMGDVGSGYLGYVIGVIAIADAREGPAALMEEPPARHCWGPAGQSALALSVCGAGYHVPSDGDVSRASRTRSGRYWCCVGRRRTPRAWC
jgi:Fuc2NAc and GlcNAc transferase